MRSHALALVIVAAFAGFSAPALVQAADADPTVSQVYEAAKAGHLDQAQQMMAQVLRDHPKSGKAHFVEAELYARQGNFAAARGELAQAESLEPGLPTVRPAAVQELRSELQTGAREGRPVMARPAASIPWGPVLLLVGLIAVVWMVVRRRSAVTPYGGGAVGGAPVYGGPGYGPGGGMAPPMGGGIGSGIAGGLASGLAVGAGVVAGEELAHHFLDGGQRGTVQPPAESVEEAPPNSDMGGSDFGVPDDSWDDSSGGDSGGGGDGWT